MSELNTQLPTETWVTATWEEYIRILEDPAFEKAKGYYYDRQMRIEMSPLGNDHASDHAIIMFAVTLFATLKGIALNGKDNCTYRKIGFQEAQPDASYYIGESAGAIPWGTSIIDLDIYPPPALVIEIANTSLAEDRGGKRLLYEDLEIAEYWIVDVENIRILAFAIADGGSRRITQSQVLPGLAMSVLEEALQRTRQMTQSQVGNWLFSQFQRS